MARLCSPLAHKRLLQNHWEISNGMRTNLQTYDASAASWKKTKTWSQRVAAQQRLSLGMFMSIATQYCLRRLWCLCVSVSQVRVTWRSHAVWMHFHISMELRRLESFCVVSMKWQACSFSATGKRPMWCVQNTMQRNCFNGSNICNRLASVQLSI